MQCPSSTIPPLLRQTQHISQQTIQRLLTTTIRTYHVLSRQAQAAVHHAPPRRIQQPQPHHQQQQPHNILHTPTPYQQQQRNISFNFGSKGKPQDESKFQFKQPDQPIFTPKPQQPLPEAPLDPKKLSTTQNLYERARAMQAQMTQPTPTPTPVSKAAQREAAKIPITPNIKERILNDPNTSRIRRAIIRTQDFLADGGAPYTLETDGKHIVLAKWIARRALYPYRALFKFFRRFGVTTGSKSRFIIPTLLITTAGIAAFLYTAFHIIKRSNMRLSRELFIRSSLVDLTARLDTYGILSTSETDGLLQRFEIIGESYAKNLHGHELMKTFLKQSLSMPIDLAVSLEDMYLPEARVDEVSNAVFSLLLDKLIDIDPQTATQHCPPHILAIASQFVDDWLRKTREQMKKEKEKVIAQEKIDASTPKGKARLEELNTGVVFDLNKTERRRLFWRGVLTGVMMETSLVALENETTFLRVARDYAMKGCILRGIPAKVKASQLELQQKSHLLHQHMEKNNMDQLITPNPALDYSFSSENEIKRIRDDLTQLPYSPQHGQIDERFLNFVFGKNFCAEYGITTDLFPYLHQVAPLALMDLATWTHPSTLFDLTSEHSPRLFDVNPLSVNAAEYEKIEMFNFMIEQFVQKDRSYEYRNKQYENSTIAKDESIVLPLYQPQDSLTNPTKFGLPRYETQLEQLHGDVPQCYQDTYGAYARAIFAFDMLILRNYLEVMRLKNELGKLGTRDVKDMKIPLLYNYYGSFDRVVGPTALDVLQGEKDYIETFRESGLRFRTRYQDNIRTDKQQFEIKPLTDYDFQREGIQRSIDQHLATDKDRTLHSVTVDSELYKELKVKPNQAVQLNPAGLMTADENRQRQRRAQKWVDNDSV